MIATLSLVHAYVGYGSRSRCWIIYLVPASSRFFFSFMRSGQVTDDGHHGVTAAVSAATTPTPPGKRATNPQP